MYADKNNTTASVKSLMDSGYNSNRGMTNGRDLEIFWSDLDKMFQASTIANNLQTRNILNNTREKIINLRNWLPNDTEIAAMLNELSTGDIGLQEPEARGIIDLTTWMTMNLPNKETLKSLANSLKTYILDNNRNNRKSDSKVMLQYLNKINELIPEVPNIRKAGQVIIPNNPTDETFIDGLKNLSMDIDNFRRSIKSKSVELIHNEISEVFDKLQNIRNQHTERLELKEIKDLAIEELMDKIRTSKSKSKIENFTVQVQQLLEMMISEASSKASEILDLRQQQEKGLTNLNPINIPIFQNTRQLPESGLMSASEDVYAEDPSIRGEEQLGKIQDKIAIIIDKRNNTSSEEDYNKYTEKLDIAYNELFKFQKKRPDLISEERIRRLEYLKNQKYEPLAKSVSDTMSEMIFTLKDLSRTEQETEERVLKNNQDLKDLDKMKKDLIDSNPDAVPEINEKIQNIKDENSHLSKLLKKVKKDFENQNQIYYSNTGRYFDPIAGNGFKKRRGRPKGCGISIPVEHNIDRSKGIEQSLKFSPFGKYIIHNGKLRDNIISLKNIKGGNVIGLPSNKVSEKFGKVIKSIIGGALPTFNDMNNLSDDEKKYLYLISSKANIVDKLNIPTPSKDQEEKDLHLFEVYKGEIMAGNDSKELIQKFKVLLLKLSRTGILPKQQVNEILNEILQLGY
jgi:hypothetical protein